MPGYRTLSVLIAGAAADDVRRADDMERSGYRLEAVGVLEAALDACAQNDAPLPGWLCGRLAVLYRSLHRYDDEVRILERYRESQSDDDARGRYDARLSKAGAIAERKRKHDTQALSSVRTVIGARREERRPMKTHQQVNRGTFSSETMAALREALTTVARDRAGDGCLVVALTALSDETRARAYGAELAVLALKEAWRDVRRPALVAPNDWDRTYQSALTMMLGILFKPGQRSP